MGKADKFSKDFQLSLTKSAPEILQKKQDQNFLIYKKNFRAMLILMMETSRKFHKLFKAFPTV